MRTIYEYIKKDTLLSVVWSAACRDRRISKSTIRRFEIDKAFKSISEIKDCKLNFVSRFLLGLVRIYFLRYRLIYEDFSNIFSVKKIKERKRLFKALPLRPITVEPENNRCMEEDKTQGDAKKVAIDGDLDNEVMEPSVNSTDNFEVGYSTIEELRGSTVQNATATQIEIKPDKRRRAVFDSKIEYDSEFFDKKVRCLRDILRKEGTKKDGVVSILGIQPEVLRGLMEQKSHFMEDQSIEIARGQSMTDVSYDPVYADTYINSRFSDPLEAIFNVYNLPEEFTFHAVVRSFSKKEKAHSFMALLTFANNGQVKASQECSYGSIECMVL